MRAAGLCCVLIAVGCRVAPSPNAAPASARQEIRRGQCGDPVFIMDSLTPRPGSIVTSSSTFRAVIHYCLPGYQPGLWRAVVFFETQNGQFISGPTTDPAADALQDSIGVVVIERSFADMWSDTRLRRPYRLHVFLNRMIADRRSTTVIDLGPYEYVPTP